MLALLLGLFYWWFLNNAERAIQEMVAIQSNGKLRVEIGKLRYNYGKKLALYKVTFINTDSAAVNNSYRFVIDELHLKTSSLSSLIRKRQLLLESILVRSPDITITRLAEKEKERAPVSLPEEMGKLYESIQKALNILQVQRFDINNAKLTLADRTDPDALPFTISRLHLHIDNFMVDTSSHERKDKFLFSDNVTLHTDHQQLLLPDGRHQIGFRNFRINIARRLVEMDSCTITALNRRGDKAIFQTALDTLKLTNVDFLSLSRHGLLKADSMYCVNPDISLDLELDSITRRSAQPLDMNRLLRHLAADMQFNYIGVKNADVAVTTTKNNAGNTFTTQGNSFELFHFAIDTKADKPVSIERFLMAIKNYEGYGKDSAYRFRFDSINFNNDRIQLNNFSITTHPGAHRAVIRNYQVPLFELEGLSWQELIFNKHIKADQAILHQPVLHYRKATGNDSNGASQKSIYEVFEFLDTLMTLDRIGIVDGTLDMQFNPSTKLNMQHVSGTINTTRLLQATSAQYIENAVNGLSFSRALFQAGQLQVQVDQAQFDGHSQSLLVNRMSLQDPSQQLNAAAHGITLQGLLINDSSQLLQIDNLSWKQAKIQWQLPEQTTARSKDSGNTARLPYEIFINGMRGANTSVELKAYGRTMSTLLQTATANTIAYRPGQPLRLQGLALTGKELQVKDQQSLLQLASYQLTDQQESLLQGLRYEQAKGKDSLLLTIPAIRLHPDMGRTAAGTLTASNILVSQPQFRILSHAKDPQQGSAGNQLPRLDINKLEIRQPAFYWQHSHDDGSFTLTMDNDPTNNITLTNIRTTEDKQPAIKVAQAKLLGHGLRWQQTGNRSSFLLKALDLHLDNSSFSRIDGEAVWTTLVREARINHLQQRKKQDSTSGLQLDAATLHNLQLRSGWLRNLSALFLHSPQLQLSDCQGRYQSAKDLVRWEGLQYQAGKKLLQLDAFTYQPHQDREAFAAAHPYQTDHIRLQTGPISLLGVDPALYFQDSIVKAQVVKIESADIQVYRDKRPPFQEGILKPLPVGLLQKIPVKFSVDSILLHNMTARYEELSDKTGQTGSIYFTGLNARLFPVRNYNLHESDSLRLYAEAKLLGQTPLRLYMRESYRDSLAGFLMNVSMSPADLTLLNPVLEPLASIRLQSGKMDTLYFEAVGREYLSLGTMHLHYDDLKVQFLKNGRDDKKRFLDGLMTFVANHLVLRHKNTSREGIIFVTRKRDRSIFNYWVKMTLSGAASSVGVKKNAKAMRRYQREIRLRNLPPIDR